MADFPTRPVELTPYQEWQLTHTCTLPSDTHVGSTWVTCVACRNGPPPELAEEVATRKNAAELAARLSPPSPSAESVSWSTTVTGMSMRFGAP
jgi:hypothetical protein